MRVDARRAFSRRFRGGTSASERSSRAACAESAQERHPSVAPSTVARGSGATLAETANRAKEVDRFDGQPEEREDATAHLVFPQLGQSRVVADHDHVELRHVDPHLLDERVLFRRGRVERDDQPVDLGATNLLEGEHALLLVDFDVAERGEADAELVRKRGGRNGKEEAHAVPIGRRSLAMKAVGGIDEAGLGPTLGPLLFGATLFRGPEAAVRDLRAALAGVVTDRFDATGQQLAIDDSKRLFAGRRTLAPLELPALAVLGPGQPRPTSLEAAVAAPESGEPWPPWYRHGASLPRAVTDRQVDGWRVRFAAELAQRGIELVVAVARPCFEAELNGCFARGLNKGDAVLACVAPLLQRLTTAAPGIDLEIVVDRLGGRRYYGDFLRHLFPLRPLSVIEEEPERSRYRLRDGSRTLEIAFEVDGDRRHLPVALASLCAKYVRELFVERLNDHFSARLPGLVPTAGYPQDAQRWLDAIAPHLLGDERERLVRQR